MLRWLLPLAVLAASAGEAVAETILVPLQQPTVADAVRIAGPGDTVVVVADARLGGSCTSAPGVRIVGSKGAVLTGALHVRGTRIGLHRLRVRDGVVRVTGSRTLVRRCVFEGDRSEGLRVSGRHARVVDCEMYSPRSTSVTILGNRAVVRSSRFFTVRSPRRNTTGFVPVGTRGIVLQGERCRVRRNHFRSIQSAIEVNGDDARVRGNTMFGGGRTVTVRGDRAVVEDTYAFVERVGIDVEGDLPTVRGNRIESDFQMSLRSGGYLASGPAIRIRSDTPGGTISGLVSYDVAVGLDLQISGAEIRAISHSGPGDVNTGTARIRIAGDGNVISGVWCFSQRSPGIELTGSRNVVTGLDVSVQNGTGLRVQGNENTLDSITVYGNGTVPQGVALLGNDNRLSDASLDLSGGTGLLVDGDANVIARAQARGSPGWRNEPTPGLHVRAGVGNVVEESTLIGSYGGASPSLLNAGSATVVRRCSLLIDAPGLHVINDGDFAVFEDNVVGAAPD